MTKTIRLLVYRIRREIPWLFHVIERIGDGATLVFFRKRIFRMKQDSRIQGYVNQQRAVVRILTPEDLGGLDKFFQNLPEGYTRNFNPHDFSRGALLKVLQKRTVLAYGLFVEGRLSGYAIAKIYCDRKIYLGWLVAPASTGLGMGKFLADYVFWQAKLGKFEPYATIRSTNIASYRTAGRKYEVIAVLSYGPELLHFEFDRRDDIKPELNILKKSTTAPRA
jgi:hypothetical protein